MTTTPLTSLIVHPSAALLPLCAESDPASLVVVASVVELGILEALKVSKGRVVDGRLRLRGAYAAGLTEVPTIEVPEEDVVSIILHSTFARRHYTKAAIGYLAYPALEMGLTEGRRRRLENLKIGVSASKPRKSTQRTIGNAEELATQFGISRSTFFEAAAIHKKFAAHPRLRAEWEPKILNGEMGLGQVQQALAGKIASLEGLTVPKGDAGQLLLGLFALGPVRFERWGRLDAAARKAAAASFRTQFLPSLPEELLDEATAYLRTRKQAA